MTEAQRLACTRPIEMLAHLRGRCTDRKLRLFACACCRQIWHLLTDAISQRAVEVAERHADGEASDQELEAAWLDAERFFGSTCSYGTSTGNQAARAASTAADPRVSFLPHMYQLSFQYMSEEWPAHIRLLRCVFGNPFSPVPFAPTWRTAAVLPLARAAYEERAPAAGTLDNARLAVLADALEEVSCTDEAVLSHLRGSGPHVRGCWCVDLALGKE